MNEIAEKPNVSLSPKDIVKQNILTQMLTGVKTKKEIAHNLGISRPTLNKYMSEMNRNEIISAELEGLKDEVIPAFMKMFNDPEDTTWKKMSADNIMKWMLKLEDKRSPDLKQNINVNIDMEKMRERDKLLNTAIARLPSGCRDILKQNIEMLKQEWGWDTEL